MRRTLARGLIIVAAALVGCRGEPVAPPRDAVAGSASDRTRPPAAPPETPPNATVQLTPHPTQHYVPPIAAKRPPRMPKSSGTRSQVADLGVVLPGAQKEHRFSITNDSQVPWTVKFITPDCQCAVGKFTSETVKPSETTQLNVTFRADQREGPVMGAIAVDFQEPQAPVFMLYLHAEVRNPLSVMPSSLDLGRVGPAERVTRTVELRNYTDRDLAPPRVQAPDWLQVTLTPVEKPAKDNHARQTWNLTVQADLGKLPPAADAGTLVVRAGDELGPVSIPITLKRKAPLEALPGEVVLDNVPPGKTTERFVLLETYPDLAILTAKDLELSHDLGEELTAEVAKKIGTNRFQLVVRYRPRVAYASFEGELTVRVRGQELPPARVKIRSAGGG